MYETREFTVLYADIAHNLHELKASSSIVNLCDEASGGSLGGCRVGDQLQTADGRRQEVAHTHLSITPTLQNTVLTPNVSVRPAITVALSGTPVCTLSRFSPPATSDSPSRTRYWAPARHRVTPG